MGFLAVIRERLAWPTGLVLGVLLISGCGSSGGDPPATTLAARYPSSKSPPVHVPPGPPPKDVVVKELKKGKGAVVPPVTTQPKVELEVLYTAIKWNGELFEERQNPRAPFEVEFGAHLNPGWEDGLEGMRVGGRRELIVPVSASWGTGSDEALVYVADLIGLKKIGHGDARKVESGGSAAESGAKPGSPPRGPTVRMSKAEIAKLPPLKEYRPTGPPPKHLEIIDLRDGSGPPVPKRDWVTNREEVFYRYIEALSYRKAREGHYIGPFSPGRVLLEFSNRGLAHGFTGMKVGGRRVLILPPKLAYPRWKPSWGYAGYVTVYVIDLIGMEPPPDRRVEYRNRPFGKQG